MVVDTSALVAIVFDEADADRFAQALARKGSSGRAGLENFLRQSRIEIVAVSISQAELAIEAFRRFGRGRHRAALNIGDCFSYALAKATDQPLLFKGNDFAQTDIRPALTA